MTLQRVTLQTDEPVFSGPIHQETANVPDKECRSHVTYNMNTALDKEPQEETTLVSHCPDETPNQADSFSFLSSNGKISSLPCP